MAHASATTNLYHSTIMHYSVDSVSGQRGNCPSFSVWRWIGPGWELLYVYYVQRTWSQEIEGLLIILVSNALLCHWFCVDEFDRRRIRLAMPLSTKRRYLGLSCEMKEVCTVVRDGDARGRCYRARFDYLMIH